MQSGRAEGNDLPGLDQVAGTRESRVNVPGPFEVLSGVNRETQVGCCLLRDDFQGSDVEAIRSFLNELIDMFAMVGLPSFLPGFFEGGPGEAFYADPQG